MPVVGPWRSRRTIRSVSLRTRSPLRASLRSLRTHSPLRASLHSLRTHSPLQASLRTPSQPQRNRSSLPPPAAPAQPMQPADPFAAPGQPMQPDDPFAAPAPPATEDPVGPVDPAAVADPFGVADPGAPVAAQPFPTAPSPFPTDTLMPRPTEGVNPDGISQLYVFVYERIVTWDGREVVVRRQLTRQEYDAFAEARRARFTEQAASGQLENFPSGADVLAWGEWTYFAEQLMLWGEYVDRVVFAGRPFPDGIRNTYSRIQWPGTPENLRQLAAGGPQLSDNIINRAEQQTLDEQVADFNPFAGLGAGGQGGQATIPPGAVFEHLTDVYNTLFSELRTMEAEQEEFMEGFEARLLERATRRLAYQDWLDDQRENLLAFVEDWNRRYHGNIAMIAGTRYELYCPGQVPTNLSPGSTVIVTDYRLTPYDILDPDTGRLREGN